MLDISAVLKIISVLKLPNNWIIGVHKKHFNCTKSINLCKILKRWCHFRSVALASSCKIPILSKNFPATESRPKTSTMRLCFIFIFLLKIPNLMTKTYGFMLSIVKSYWNNATGTATFIGQREFQQTCHLDLARARHRKYMMVGHTALKADWHTPLKPSFYCCFLQKSRPAARDVQYWIIRLCQYDSHRAIFGANWRHANRADKFGAWQLEVAASCELAQL